MDNYQNMLKSIGDNLYCGKYHFFTEEELEWMDRLRVEWEKGLVRQSFINFIDQGGTFHSVIYDEKLKKRILKKTTKKKACQMAIKFFKEQIKKDKEKIGQLRVAARSFCIGSKLPEVFAEAMIEIFIDEEREKLLRKIKRNTFLISRLKFIQIPAAEMADSNQSGHLSEQDIEMARTTPIENFLQTNRAGFTCCPLHKEKTPSFKVYLKTNSWYCFGCHEGGNVVDLTMKMNNVAFRQAIKMLINK